MPRKPSTLEADERATSASEAKLEPLDLTWTDSSFDFHRVPSGSHRLTVAQRLAAAGISVRQDPATPAGRMALFRHDSGEELGAFTARAALEQLVVGFASTGAKSARYAVRKRPR